jgi:2-isopropylmalate synthase
MSQVKLYDTTLRDGAQREGVSFSVVDKLNICYEIDKLGVHYIEGGWPGSNPKDAEFFRRAQTIKLKKAVIVAFGSTRRAGITVGQDANLAALSASGVKAVCLVGKSSAAQVRQVLETTLKENLAMIADSIAFFKDKGITAFFDAEHFFDGFKADPEYALRTLEAAYKAGSDCLVLCDTNGGALPEEVAGIVAEVRDRLPKAMLGIHTHNDMELAVANSLAAVEAGVTQVQGTINGYGERCGNANLCSIIPTLKLKMDVNCVTSRQLSKLTEVSRHVSEMANLRGNPFWPYVGSSSFSHKGGIHVAALRKWEGSYQHIDPALVGNQPKVVVSELSGKSNILYKAGKKGINVPLEGKEAASLLEKIKKLESQGFQYDNAEASLELLMKRAVPGYKAPFKLVDFMVVVESLRRPPTRKGLNGALSEAMIKVSVEGETMHTAAEGNGPVNALDEALRKALLPSYPRLAEITLVDYKVRILEGSTGTVSQVRVLIESEDAVDKWYTVGSSGNIIEASWLALADSLEWWIDKQKLKPVSRGRAGK